MQKQRGSEAGRGAEKKRERGWGDLLIYTENDVTPVRVGNEPRGCGIEGHWPGNEGQGSYS